MNGPFSLASLLASGNQWVQIAIIVLILIIAWGVLRAVLRLTARIFTLGCGAILVLAIVLYLLRYFSH